jgi:phosphopantothenoylcysteine synthetase/decarboxylase
MSNHIVLGVTGSIAAYRAVDIASLLVKGGADVHVVTLADDTKLLVIAPATANVIAKLAHGIADDALTCIALALNPNARLVLAPAMNGKMWQHPATQQNVATLKSRGVKSSARMPACSPAATKASAGFCRWNKSPSECCNSCGKHSLEGRRLDAAFHFECLG